MNKSSCRERENGSLEQKKEHGKKLMGVREPQLPCNEPVGLFWRLWGMLRRDEG